MSEREQLIQVEMALAIALHAVTETKGGMLAVGMGLTQVGLTQDIGSALSHVRQRFARLEKEQP